MQEPSGSTPIKVPPHDPWIGTLPNGLDVLIKPVPEAPVCSVQVWCRTGSIHECEHLGAGLSHLLEHMLFNHTEKRPGGQISKDVQAAGAYINAYTSFDRTVYWIETPPASLETSIDILADMTLRSTLEKSDYEKELEVIRREMAMGDDQPSQVCSKLMFRTAFRAHPVRFPVIGHREIFDQITHEELIGFYQNHYVPNNMFVVICGPVDIDETLEQIETHFGSAARSAVSPAIITPEPTQQGVRTRHLEANAQLSSLRQAWHTPGLTHRDTVPLDVFTTVLGTGRSSRLYREIRENQRLAHSVAAYLYAMSDTGLFILGAEVDPDKREAAEAGMMRVLEETLEDGIEDAEVDKAIHMAMAEALGQLTTTRGQASDIGSSWHLTGTAEFTTHYLEALQQVDADSILTTARQYLRPSNVSVVSVNPTGTLPARKASTSTSEDQSVHRCELSNGLTLLVKPESRLPLVTIHTTFRGGLLSETEENSGISRMFARLLTRDAAGKSAEEIVDRIESAGGEFSPFSGNNSLGVSSEMMRPDWELGLESVANAIQSADFLESTIDREKEAQLAALKAEDDRPMNVAGRLLRTSMFPNHPYSLSVSGLEESIQGIHHDDLVAYREQHLTARNGVIAIYGDVKVEEAREAAERRFANLPVGERLYESPTLIQPPTEAILRSETHEKEQSILLAGFPTGSLFHEDALTLELIDDACSDMSSRLFTRIREEMGAAYMVGCQRMLGYAGGGFYFYVATSPHQIDEVEGALREEIQNLATNGLGADEFERAKVSWQGSHLTRLQSVGGRARIQALDELFGLGWDRCHSLPAAMDAITPQQVQEVAERTFGGGNGVVARLTS